MSKTTKTQFTISANNLSQEEQNSIVYLLQDLMDDYNEVKFEASSCGMRVHIDAYDID